MNGQRTSQILEPTTTGGISDLDMVLEDALRRPFPTETNSTRIEKGSNLLETWESYWPQVALPGIDTRTLEIKVLGRTVYIKGQQHAARIDSARSFRRARAIVYAARRRGRRPGRSTLS
jgi:HSP20 family molecular chaperone IbpA